MPPSRSSANEPERASRRRWLIHLRIRVAEENQERLLAFLREALPYYEQPDGVRIRLLQSRDDPRRFIEIVEYEDRNAYDRDQVRVETDPQMRALLDRWHALLDGSVEVETYEEITDLLAEP